MKIGIDARIYKTGIGRYCRNLLKELVNVAEENDEFVVFLRKDGFDEYIPSDERFHKVLADFSPYSFVEQLVFPWVLWQEKLDLVHFTNFNLPILWPKKFVVTIHDLIHQSHSTYGSSTRNRLYYSIKKLVYLFVIRWVGLRATKILVPSEATKRDVVDSLGANPDKVVVTYEGVEEEWKYQISNLKYQKDGKGLGNSAQEVLKKYDIKQPYLLYVATMYPHKNHEKLIEAFQLLQKDSPSLSLVLVGKVDFFSQRLKHKIQIQGLSKNIIFPNFKCENGYLPDEDLRILYQNAAAYVFPSLKEGFGIPILEAQAYGVPVVCANISCLPEIGGDSVLYFEPEDAEDIAEKISLVLKDGTLRKELQEKGNTNLKRFSWRTMGDQTYQTYNAFI